jgi:cytoskeletal protein CcmA (bactofilin family)
MFSWNRPQTSSDRPTGNPPPDAPHPTRPSADALPALPQVAPPNRRFTDGTSVCATRLGRLQIRGTLTSTESVELGGTFDGPVEVEGLFKVTDGGRVNGTIRAQDAAISGEVHGHVSVRGRLELGATAHVLADVEAKTIAIAEGAFIAGRVAMPGGTGTAAHDAVAVHHVPQTTSFKEKRRDRKKRHRAAVAAHEAATHPVEAAPQADGTTEPPTES